MRIGIMSFCFVYLFMPVQSVVSVLCVAVTTPVLCFALVLEFFFRDSGLSQLSVGMGYLFMTFPSSVPAGRLDFLLLRLLGRSVKSHFGLGCILELTLPEYNAVFFAWYDLVFSLSD